MNKKLLVVDDDTDIRELLEFDLSQSGYDVDTAKDGLEGLQKAISNNYDLVLLDVMMPKMNGFDVCKNIRVYKPNIPILLLTAKGTITDKTDGFNSGADDYIVKPFDVQEVLLRVRVLLRRNSSAEAPQSRHSQGRTPRLLRLDLVEIRKGTFAEDSDSHKQSREDISRYQMDAHNEEPQRDIRDG